MGVEDIEEVGGLLSETPRAQGRPAAPAVLRRREQPSLLRRERRGGSLVPGDATVYLRTWFPLILGPSRRERGELRGCSHNGSDGEYMAGLLGAAGYRVTQVKTGADLWLLNSCTVKTPSETAIKNQLEEAAQLVSILFDSPLAKGRIGGCRGSRSSSPAASPRPRPTRLGSRARASSASSRLIASSRFSTLFHYLSIDQLRVGRCVERWWSRPWRGTASGCCPRSEWAGGGWRVRT